MTSTETLTPVALAYKTLDHIAANPDEWDQSDWRCETGMCFAGWAAQLAGGKWANPTMDWSLDISGAALIAQPDDPEFDRYYGREGFVGASSRAKRLLGLDIYEADRLFAASNSLEDLELLVADLFGPAPELVSA